MLRPCFATHGHNGLVYVAYSREGTTNQLIPFRRQHLEVFRLHDAATPGRSALARQPGLKIQRTVVAGKLVARGDVAHGDLEIEAARA